MNDTAEQVVEETESTGDQEVILFDKNQITQFDPFRAELDELKRNSDSLVFDYSDPKQYKAGVSHVAKLRTSKTAVENLRKKTGQPAFDYKKEVDNQGNGLIEELDELIESHAKLRREYDEKQQARKDVHERNMLVFSNYKSTFEYGAEVGSIEIKALIKVLMDLDIDETWEEYQEPARMAREEAFKDLKPRLEQRIQIEENAEKLAKLEKENEEREEREEEQRKADEQKQREEDEAKEAAEQKERDEKEADTKRINAINIRIGEFEESLRWNTDSYELSHFESELVFLNNLEINKEFFEEFTDKAKLRKIDAIASLEKLIQLKKDRIEEQERLQKLEDEKLEREQKEQEEADEQAERDLLAADESHREEVNAKIKKIIIEAACIDSEAADDIIDLLATGSLPNVTLTY